MIYLRNYDRNIINQHLLICRIVLHIIFIYAIRAKPRVAANLVPKAWTAKITADINVGSGVIRQKTDLNAGILHLCKAPT